MELKEKRAQAELEEDDPTVSKIHCRYAESGRSCQYCYCQSWSQGDFIESGQKQVGRIWWCSYLSKAWAVSLLRRMNYTKRRSTTKCSMPPENFTQEKSKFLQQIVNLVKMEDISPDLIFNWDQTGLNLHHHGPWLP